MASKQSELIGEQIEYVFGQSLEALDDMIEAIKSKESDEVVRGIQERINFLRGYLNYLRELQNQSYLREKEQRESESHVLSQPTASVGDMLKILELDMAQLRQELNELRDISNTFQKLASDKEFQKHVQTKLMDAFDKDWEEQHESISSCVSKKLAHLVKSVQAADGEHDEH